MSETYRIAIDFFDFDPTAPPSLSQSPLHPNTPTLLPPALDRDLRAKQPSLCLPRTFWQNLPYSAPLDLTEPHQPAPAPAQPPLPQRTLSDQASTQKATLDFRFGPLSIDWVDYPQRRLPPTSPGLPPADAASSSAWLSTSPRPSPAQLRRPLPSMTDRPPEKSGTTELYWGTVHLYRELGAEADDSTAKDKQSAMDLDDGTVVGMVAVPGNVTAAALLAFISPALDRKSVV